MSEVVKLGDVFNSIPNSERRKNLKKEKQIENKIKKTSEVNKKRNTKFDEQFNETINKKKTKKSSKLGFSKRDNYSRCKNSAIYSLAMREHSRKEIRNKLALKEYVEGVDVDKLLDELEESNYLNEERFVESFIRYRSGRGQGFMKISNDLRQRGITASLINTAMQEANLDWFQLAKMQREKKFGKTKAIDFKEKTRQMRFLYGRGFDSEVIRTIVG